MTQKKIKAWIVLNKKGKPAKFCREGTPIEYQVFPKKEKMNEDFYRVLPCTVIINIKKRK